MYELTMTLDIKSKVPLYEQIYEFIKEEIRKDALHSGERLPSTRALSKHLEVSRSTVELAYEQLLSEGYVEAQPYKGYYVAKIEGLYQIQKKQEISRKQVVSEKVEYTYDFTPNGVDLNSFPYNIWRKLSRESLLDDKAELFRLGNPQGEYGLRNAISSYLHQARGVHCNPDQIIIGAGSDYLLMLLTTVIGNRHKVALENPTYGQAYRLFERLSYDVCTVDLDQSGMLIHGLEESGADIAFVMPSHQYPLGCVMPIQRRMELLKWANEKEDRYIIEDDYDSEFRYKGKPIPALQGSDNNGRVIYTGTFSKSLAPSIRMSYMVLPEKILKIYQEKCRFISSTVSRVDQMILQKFMEEGYYERHLNKTRALYKSRHDILISCLRGMKDILEISGENAGVHLLLHFKGAESEKELIEKAAQKGVRVYGLSEYYVKDKEIPEENKKKAVILLGYANLNEEKIRAAVRLLQEAWDMKNKS